MEFDVQHFYDAPSAELEGKRAFLSNSMSSMLLMTETLRSYARYP